jgi:hypothetical protein
MVNGIPSQTDCEGFTSIVSPSKGVICLEGAVTLIIKDSLLACPSKWVAQLLNVCFADK